MREIDMRPHTNQQPEQEFVFIADPAAHVRDQIIWSTMLLLFALGALTGLALAAMNVDKGYFALSIPAAAFGLIGLVKLVKALRDRRDGASELVGTVAKKWIEPGDSEVQATHWIEVSDHTFNVGRDGFSWIGTRDHVVVRRFLHSDTPIKITRTRR